MDDTNLTNLKTRNKLEIQRWEDEGGHGQAALAYPTRRITRILRQLLLDWRKIQQRSKRAQEAKR